VHEAAKNARRIDDQSLGNIHQVKQPSRVISFKPARSDFPRGISASPRHVVGYSVRDMMQVVQLDSPTSSFGIRQPD
jgi:hypothetical protein